MEKYQEIPPKHRSVKPEAEVGHRRWKGTQTQREMQREEDGQPRGDAEY